MKEKGTTGPVTYQDGREVLSQAADGAPTLWIERWARTLACERYNGARIDSLPLRYQRDLRMEAAAIYASERFGGAR